MSNIYNIQAYNIRPVSLSITFKPGRVRQWLESIGSCLLIVTLIVFCLKILKCVILSRISNVLRSHLRRCLATDSIVVQWSALFAFNLLLCHVCTVAYMMLWIQISMCRYCSPCTLYQTFLCPVLFYCTASLSSTTVSKALCPLKQLASFSSQCHRSKCSARRAMVYRNVGVAYKHLKCTTISSGWPGKVFCLSASTLGLLLRIALLKALLKRRLLGSELSCKQNLGVFPMNPAVFQSELKACSPKLDVHQSRAS